MNLKLVENVESFMQANQATSIGKYIPGVYAIDAEKDTEYGHFTGQMKFDFRYAKGNTVEVNENFNEASLKVKLKGKSDLDKNIESNY